jgi:phage-related minor tail protein
MALNSALEASGLNLEELSNSGDSRLKKLGSTWNNLLNTINKTDPEIKEVKGAFEGFTNALGKVRLGS